MKKLYVYTKKNDSNVLVKELIYKASEVFGDAFELYTDVDRDFLAYKALKNSLLEAPGFLIVSSIKNLGTNDTERYEELLWFKDKGIRVAFGDYPATQIFNDDLANELSLDVLIDVYSILKDDNLYDIKNAASKNKGGRKKINFPDNWEFLYRLWDKGEITAKEFMAEAGLKKGTFYHLVTEYKELMELNKKVISTDKKKRVAKSF